MPVARPRPAPSAKSVVMPRSRTYSRPSNSRTSLGSEATDTEPSGAWRSGIPPSATGVPTPAGV